MLKKIYTYLYLFTMAAINNISLEQLNILLSFLEENRHLAFGRLSTDSESQYEHHFKWKELARNINALDMSSAKAGIEYKAYWLKLKNKTYGKVYKARRRAKVSKQPVKLTLREHEWRIYNIMSGDPIDKFLIMKILKDTVQSTNTSFTDNSKKIEEQNKKDDILMHLQSIADSLQSLAKSQAELAQAQISIIKNLLEVSNLIKDN